MTEEAVKEKMNFGSSSSNSESAEKVRIQESSNIGDNAQEALSGTDRNFEAGPTENFENVYVAGTIGIGVASPSEKLEVSGIIKAIAFVGDGSEITALDGEKITNGIIEDSRIPSTVSRENRFDPTNGHKHTGAAGDGPIISHSKLDEVLSANSDSSDTVLTKHVSDALVKGWQDHVMTKSGNPHGTTAIDVGALPNVGGTINGSLQVNGNIGTTGTVDGVDVSSLFNVFTGHKHTGAAGDGPKISHNNLDNILAVNTNSPDTISNKHVSDSLAKSWNDHIMTKSGNPHGTTATSVGALPISGGTINGTLQVNGNIGVYGNVVIGTTNPDKNNKLQVEGNLHMNGNSIFLRVNPADQFDVIKWNSSSDRVDIGGFNGVNLCRTRGGASPVLAPALSVDANGNVGIGTTSPDNNNKLQVEGNLHMNGNPIFLRKGPSDQFDIIKWNSSADRIDVGGYNGVNICYTNGANNPITLKPALSVDSKGNIGIGTTSPDNNNKLQVEGNLHMNGNPIFLRKGPSDQYDIIKWNSTGDRIDIGGFNGVSLCYTKGAAKPVLTPILNVDSSGIIVAGSMVGGETTTGWALGRGAWGPDNWLRITTARFGNTYHDLAINRLWAAGATRYDLAEVTPVKDEDKLEQGDVVVIDEENGLRVKRSTKPFDTSVYGIVSSYESAAMVIGGAGPETVVKESGKLPVALIGRVKAKVTAEAGEIQVGDLLTTSSTPGHLMKCSDASKITGAVAGKALESLKSDKGMITVLVTLQ